MLKRFLAVVSGAVFLSTLSLPARTVISGDISDMIFNESGSPYLVEGDIVVPEKKKAVVQAGSIFLFNPFTGLKIQGHLIAEGASEKPIVFTSLHDPEFNPDATQLPNPFDWNGILVAYGSSGTRMRHISVRYSVYGIKAQYPDIRIEHGVFRQNGQFHFTIDDKIQLVQDNIPYSYNITPVERRSGAEGVVAPRQREPGIRKPLIRITTLGTGLAAAGVGGLLTARSLQAAQRRDRSWEQGEGRDAWNQAEQERRGYMQAGTIAFILGGLSLAGFGVTFVF